MANVYWTSPSGGAANYAAAESDTALVPEDCCTLAQALAGVSAGHTVKMRGGIYDEAIYLATVSGTSGSRITFEAHTGETVEVKNTDNLISGYTFGLLLISSSYVTIRGIKFTAAVPSVGNGARPFMMRTGANYVELDSCEFDGTPMVNRRPPDIPIIAPQVYDTCSHGWIHDCDFHDIGFISADGNDEGGCLQIGAANDASATESSDNWTIENNRFYHGAHHVLETHGQYCVIRGNQMWNEGWIDNPNDPLGVDQKPPDPGPITGNYGNRCLQLDCYSDINPEHERYSLIENNEMRGSGAPPDDNGDGVLSIASGHNLVRLNEISGAIGRGVFFKNDLDAGYNTLYNNTLFHVGRRPDSRADAPYVIIQNAIGLSSFSGDGVNNAIVNNLIYDGLGDAIARTSSGGDVDDAGTDVRGNWVGTKVDGVYPMLETDPLFTDETIPEDRSSTTQPDLSWNPASGAKDNGVGLTATNGTGTDSTALVVDNAMFFQDGSWGSSLSTVEADWIAVGTVDNVAQISSIDYATNTITLATALTWTDGQDVWLYKDSSANRTLYGSAPDQGSYQAPVPDQPTSLTLTAL